MQGPEVFADLTFVNNFIMDFILLWAAVRLAGISVHLNRLLSAALLGGLYAVGFLWQPWPWLYTFSAKIVISIVMVIIAIPTTRWTEYLKCLVYFYIVNFTVAGATIALSFLLSGTKAVTIFRGSWIVFALIMASGIGMFGGRYIRQHLLPGLLKFSVQLRFGTRSCQGQGFVDTGNALKDPLTNKPVIVAEYALLKHCLPYEFQQAVEVNANEEALLDDLISTGWANRLRLIPFTSIGRKNGMLLGIRADEVVMTLGSKNVSYKDTVIGIYRDQLNPKGTYQMLIPRDMVEG